MKVRHKARGFLVHRDELLLLRRGWPGGEPYCTAVGGSVEPGDADIEAALRREALEEIGATLGPAAEVLTLTEDSGATVVVQHFFLARVLTLDAGLRHGPEFADPDLGEFTLLRTPLTASAVTSLNLQPPEAAAFASTHIATWSSREGTQ
ncbi:NUDIX domain-containing protein [Actinacidiphila alni]|uniref:NUDIX domain-containing protein n=1 Tax=Actinacidiphila alni TaxID=380248 RepID=UPI0033EAD099